MEILNDAIDILSKDMIKNDLENKKNDKEVYIKIKKTNLYSFCIKLLKLIKEIDENDINN